MKKKYSKLVRSVFIALFATVLLALIGVARLFGYESPKVSTVFVNFITIFGTAYVTSVCLAALNKGIMMQASKLSKNSDFAANAEKAKSESIW